MPPVQEEEAKEKEKGSWRGGQLPQQHGSSGRDDGGGSLQDDARRGGGGGRNSGSSPAHQRQQQLLVLCQPPPPPPPAEDARPPSSSPSRQGAAATTRMSSSPQVPPSPPPPSPQQHQHPAAATGATCAPSLSCASPPPPSASLSSRPCQGPRHRQQEEHFHAGGVTDDALRAFRDAMDLVEPGAKAGYVRARATCRECVLVHECCPCHFLAASDLNPWAAAARMCSYWNERISLFGEDRAFAALTLGSCGAPPTGLTPEDVRVFERGTMMALPADKHGRSVIYYDDRALDPDMAENTLSRLRVLWYIFQAAYTSGEAMAHRVVVLIECHFPPLGGRYGPAAWRFSRACRKFPTALPIVVDSIHLLTLSSRTGSGLFIKLVIGAATEMAGGYLSTLVRMHHGRARFGTVDPVQADREAKQSLLRELRGLGFTPRGLPEFAGGLYTADEDFGAWARRRRRREHKLFWTSAQRAQQKRDVNKIHSRQKRMRRVLEAEELREEAQQLEIANVRARTVGDILEMLVAEANAVVKRLKRGDGDDGDAGDDWTASSHKHRRSASQAWAFEEHLRGAEGLAEGSSSSAAAPATELDVKMLAALEPDPIAPNCLPSVAQPHDGGAAPWLRGPFVPAHPSLAATYNNLSSACGTVGSRHSASSQLPDSWHAEDPGVQHAYLAGLERHESSSTTTSLSLLLQLPPPPRAPNYMYPNTLGAGSNGDPLRMPMYARAASGTDHDAAPPSSLSLPAAFRHGYTAGMSSLASFFLNPRDHPTRGADNDRIVAVEEPAADRSGRPWAEETDRT
jgi:hypothetical protein